MKKIILPLALLFALTVAACDTFKGDDPEPQIVSVTSEPGVEEGRVLITVEFDRDVRVGRVGFYNDEFGEMTSFGVWGIDQSATIPADVWAITKEVLLYLGTDPRAVSVYEL